MKDIFVPEDFSGIEFSKEAMCAKVNRILKERLLNGAREIFVTLGNNHITHISSIEFQEATHRMLGVNIQKLEPKVCQHEAKILVKAGHQPEIFEPVCFHCGVKLKAVWAAVT